MASNICPKCQIALFPKEENDIVVIVCKVCGFRKEIKNWIETECPHCSHNKATVVLHEMAKGDEGTTTMYRCIHCGAINKEGFMGF